MFITCEKDEEKHDFSKTVGLLFYAPANDWRQAAVVYGVDQAESIGLNYELKLSATAAQQEKALRESTQLLRRKRLRMVRGLLSNL